METWDVYDKELNKTGKTFFEKSQLKSGEYGYIVHIIIVDENNNFLLQQRSFNKKYYPGMWDATCGKVQSGETGIQGAMREVREELGIISSEEEYKCFYHKLYKNATVLDIFLLRKNFDIHSLSLQKEEVEKAKLYSFEKMLKILTPTKDKEYLDVLYEIKKHLEIDVSPVK